MGKDADNIMVARKQLHVCVCVCVLANAFKTACVEVKR